MISVRLFTVTTSAAALLLGTSAHADVTANEVWDAWQKQMNGYVADSLTIGSEVMTGDTLTVSDIAFSSDYEGTTVSMDIEQMTLTETGEGTVKIQIPDIINMVVAETDDPAENRGVFAFTTSGLNLIAGGTPEAMEYDLSADKYLLELVESVEGGEPVDATASVTLNDLAGRYLVKGSDITETEYEVNAASMNLFMNFQDGSEGFEGAGQVFDIAMNSTMAMPDLSDDADPEDAFVDGLAINTSYETGSSSLLLTISDPSGETLVTATTEGSDTSVVMNKDVVDMSTVTQNLQLDIQGGPVPFPVVIEAETLGFNFGMPLSATEEPQDFNLGLDITALSVSDMLWMLADPTNALPHDPITAQIALSGAARLFFDLTDPEQAEALDMAEVPGELNSLNLDQLNISAVGATITGDGSFTFDNSDTETFSGFPRPEGAVSLRGEGINGLIDNLQTMQLPISDQIMGLRMMLGMFTTVVGDDALETEVTVNEQGHVSINGQRMY